MTHRNLLVETIFINWRKEGSLVSRCLHDQILAELAGQAVTIWGQWQQRQMEKNVLLKRPSTNNNTHTHTANNKPYIHTHHGVEIKKQISSKESTSSKYVSAAHYVT
jgi:hypothetical protein